jgi:hypothetical protein
MASSKETNVTGNKVGGGFVGESGVSVEEPVGMIELVSVQASKGMIRNRNNHFLHMKFLSNELGID